LPADFLLPLFTLTLLANAVLVAFAIRGMRRGHDDPDRPTGFDRSSGASTPASPAPGRSSSDELARASAARTALLDPPVASDLPPVLAEPAPSPAVRTPVPTEAIVQEAPRIEAAAPPQAGPTATKRPRGPKATESAGRSQPNEPGKRGRRRFSLPPLDDDHEKVSRSIETFLGGVEMAADDVAAPAGNGDVSVGATTVAIVAVDGLPALPRRSRSARSATDDDATSSALAMVERTIRGAARGTDIVSVADRGRFRIVLPGTGELAARAYLRRIRATVEPLLESADRPLRLAVATATVLDEPIADAVRRADVRLTAALAAMNAPDLAGGPVPGAPTPDAAAAAGDPDAKPANPKPRAAAD
jgi:hypothetical protein